MRHLPSTVTAAVAVAAASWAAPVAHAASDPPLVVTYDEGGSIIERYAELRALTGSGRRVILDGVCMSACTLYLSLPPGQVCATRRARLLFHHPYDPDTGALLPGTAGIMGWTYPTAVREWLERNGGLTAETRVLSGKELARIVPTCGRR
jgi:hypothetical protein